MTYIPRVTLSARTTLPIRGRNGARTASFTTSQLSDSVMSSILLSGTGTPATENERSDQGRMTIIMGPLPHQSLELSSSSEEGSATASSASHDEERESTDPNTPPRRYRQWISPVLAPKRIRATSPPDSPSPSTQANTCMGGDEFDPVGYEEQIPVLDEAMDIDSELDVPITPFDMGSASSILASSLSSDNSRGVVKRVIKRDALFKTNAQTPVILLPPSSKPSATLEVDLENSPTTKYPILRSEQQSNANMARINESERREKLRTDLIAELNTYKLRSPPSPTSFKRKPTRAPQTRPPPQLQVMMQDVESAYQERGTYCDACGVVLPAKRIEMIPCGDTVCSRFWSSALAAVSMTHGRTVCPACTYPIDTFQQIILPTEIISPPRSTDHPTTGENTSPVRKSDGQTEVLRIDNVAWDITPEIVHGFLPPDVLPSGHAAPIHVLLDRYDGRTKDYLYVEVCDLTAVRSVLQKCQNQYMPGGILTGGRKRPVTISRVGLAELLQELRPKGPGELQSLLNLCRASVCTPPMASTYPESPDKYSGVVPNGVAHFVKSRHGPFHALMSILTKLRGRESPIYWDLFASGELQCPSAKSSDGDKGEGVELMIGAIAALASAIARQKARPMVDPFSAPPTTADDQSSSEDIKVLERLQAMFQRCFGTLPA